MSYSILIFHPSVKDQVDAGKEIDEFKHAALALEDVTRFLERLEKYGYVLESENSRCREYVKKVGTCPIQVAIFPSEISFSIPYWEGSEDAIAEALQDASELADADGTVVFNPQENEWDS